MPPGFNPRDSAHVRRAALDMKDYYLEEDEPSDA